MDVLTLLDYLIRGLSLGSVYAIIALGYTMVYGIAKMLNFAHGDVIMVGAYVCFFAMTGLSPMFEAGSMAAAVVPALAGVVLSMAVCTVLGVVIEGLAYKPLRQAPSLAVLITAIGVSYFLQNSALILWSSSPKIFSPIVGSGSQKIGPLTISHVTHWRLSRAYLFTDLLVLGLSLTYIPVKKIFFSVITVTLSSFLIDRIQGWRCGKPAEAAGAPPEEAPESEQART